MEKEAAGQGEMTEIEKKFLLLLVVPFVMVLVFFYTMLSLSARGLIKEVHRLSVAQAETTSLVLSFAAAHLLEESVDKLRRFTEVLFQQDKVIYVALLKDGKLLYWNSKYEGFLPIEPGTPRVRIFSTPAGSMLELKSSVPSSGSFFEIYIGYEFEIIDKVKSASRRNLIYLLLLSFLLISLSYLYVLRTSRLFLERERELLREREEKERFKEMSLLAGALSHEIKNPLNSLYLTLQMLEQELEDATLKEYVRTMKGELRRLNSSVESHMGFLRMRPVKRPADLKKVAEEALEALGQELKGGGIKIHLLGEPVEVETDVNLLKTVIINLLKNSVEAGATSIEVETGSSGSVAYIEVRDNGPGIKEEQLPQVFKPYFSTKLKGTGIGLTLSKRIMETLGGSLSLENLPGGGLKVLIALPKGGEDADSSD